MGEKIIREKVYRIVKASTVEKLRYDNSLEQARKSQKTELISWEGIKLKQVNMLLNL